MILMILSLALQQGDAAYNEGCRLAKEERHAEALAKFEEALKHAPDDPDYLYNAGISSYLSGRFGPAAQHWERLAGKEPANLQLRAKLVQAYQASGDTAKRDAARAKLLEMRAALPEETRKKTPRFSRDQFHAGPGKVRVIAYEHYEFAGERPVRYVFSVRVDGTSGAKEAYTISLGSYEVTTRIARENGEIGPGERLWHLDEYRGGAHRTLGFFKKEPTYEEAAKQVVEALEGGN